MSAHVTDLRPYGPELAAAKRRIMEEILGVFHQYGDAGWVTYERLLEACYGKDTVSRHHKWVTKSALSDLVQRGHLREQIPVNDPDNPHYQPTDDPLKLLAEL